ncbi:DUF5011 domain-containing protein [Erwinia sp. CPCC 100877]|nr:DUF5011 domain-containing protein [Erwinia sp. CPCC 100877]
MQKRQARKTIILSSISILTILLFIGGYVWADSVNRENQPQASTATSVNKTAEHETEKKEKTKKKLSTASETTVTDAKADQTPPTIEAPATTVQQGEALNVYNGVTATDADNTDLTSQLQASETTVDTSALGDYTVHFTVTDSDGNTAAADRTIHVIPAAEAAVQENTQPTVEAEQAVPIEKTPAETQTAASSTPVYEPMTIYMNDQSIPYQNGGQATGQSIIDANPSGIAATWGGAAVQSGDDGQNTHFIGHNPGAFATIFSLGTGSQIVVTDANATPTTYTIRTLLQLNDYGEEVNTGKDYWDLTVGTGDGERITLQSCINDEINLIVIAYK